MTTASLSLALPVKLGCCLYEVPLRPRTSASCTNARLLLPQFDESNRIGSVFRRASERDFKFESLIRTIWDLRSQKASLREQLLASEARKGCNGPALTSRLV